MKHKIRQLHFVGIGGSGMSGIAEVLHNLGYQVSGSDVSNSSIVEHLRSLGITVFIGHNAAHIAGANALVISTAVREDNPEVQAARAARIPVVPRALMLAELMRLKQGIAIAGTHGKTTTTSLVASVLAEAGLDPTFVIGGRLNSAGTNSRLGSGQYIVVEADESDASFLHLHPMIAVITNIDRDHMETYGHDLERLKQAFIEFTHLIPFYGAVMACIDDENVRAILPSMTSSVVTYGFAQDAQVRASDVGVERGMMRFTLTQTGYDTQTVLLNQPGLHNVKNACAAIAIARELEIPDAPILRALEHFAGVGRRFTRYGVCAFTDKPEATYQLVDDYGHHPVEIATTLDAARRVFPEQRLILIFQPHRYSRTRDLFEEFVRVLGLADVLILCAVYPAGEDLIAAADSKALARALRIAGKVEPIYADDLTMAQDILHDIVCANDLVMTMGAGSVGQLPQRLHHPPK